MFYLCSPLVSCVWSAKFSNKNVCLVNFDYSSDLYMLFFSGKLYIPYDFCRLESVQLLELIK